MTMVEPRVDEHTRILKAQLDAALKRSMAHEEFLRALLADCRGLAIEPHRGYILGAEELADAIDKHLEGESW
jgi:hypothetical protein